MTATRTAAPEWLGDYVDELSELGLLPVDAAADLLPLWIADIGAYAAGIVGQTVITVTDHAGDERVSVSLFDLRGWMLHETLSFSATALGFRLMFAMLGGLATPEGSL